MRLSLLMTIQCSLCDCLVLSEDQIPSHCRPQGALSGKPAIEFALALNVCPQCWCVRTKEVTGRVVEKLTSQG